MSNPSVVVTWWWHTPMGSNGCVANVQPRFKSRRMRGLPPEKCDNKFFFTKRTALVQLVLIASQLCIIDPAGSRKSKGKTSHIHLQIYTNTDWWFGTCFLFFHILGIIIPTDFNMFQRGWNHQPVYFLQFNLANSFSGLFTFDELNEWKNIVAKSQFKSYKEVH